MVDTLEQLVYVTGSGHSGSTLLDLLLSQHSQIVALGEAHRLYLNLRRTTKAHCCTCGRTVLDCSFWRGVEAQLISMSGGRYNFQSLLTTNPDYLELPDDATGDNIYEPVPNKLLKIGLPQLACVLGSKHFFAFCARFSSSVEMQKRIGEDSHILYRAVRKFSGKPIVVDSTKTPMRLKILYMTSQVPFKVIYLVRDGRAVTAARMRRQKLSMDVAARIWKAEHKKIAAVLHTIPTEFVHKVHYEEMCKKQKETFEKLADFLGVEFETEMLNLRKERSHSLGGNTMRWRTAEKEVSLDQRWRFQLSAEDMEKFERVAGRLNRGLGYIDE